MFSIDFLSAWLGWLAFVSVKIRSKTFRVTDNTVDTMLNTLWHTKTKKFVSIAVIDYFLNTGRVKSNERLIQWTDLQNILVMYSLQASTNIAHENMGCDSNVYLSVGWHSRDPSAYSVLSVELFFFSTSLFYGELTPLETWRSIRISFKQI